MLLVPLGIFIVQFVEEIEHLGECAKFFLRCRVACEVEFLQLIQELVIAGEAEESGEFARLGCGGRGCEFDRRTRFVSLIIISKLIGRLMHVHLCSFLQKVNGDVSGRHVLLH